VGEALAVGAFVAGADVVEDANVDDRGLAQGGIDDEEAVVESLLSELYAVGGGGNAEEEKEKKQRGGT
jgi:hypothetical protein